ncbi:hypothetical protein ACFL2Q_00850 [Thermodesulfobacteriota bacterium]
MYVTKNHIIGFLGGVGVSALGFYLYKKNQSAIDEFLRSQGIPVPGSQTSDPGHMTLEELVREKERLEDLIAEREIMRKTEAKAG